MLVKEIFLGFIGLTAGFAVSAGTFAFMIVLGVLPRMIGKCNRAAETLHFENMIMLGGIFGNIISVFLNLKLPFGTWFYTFMGSQPGCSWAVLPSHSQKSSIHFRLRSGGFISNRDLHGCFFMAIGKMSGSLYYF